MKRLDARITNTTVPVFGLPLCCQTKEEIGSLVLRCAQTGKGLRVHCIGLGDVVSANEDIEINNAFQDYCLLTMDGMPLVWMAQQKLKKKLDRGYGPDLMSLILKMSAKTGIVHYLVGGQKESLDKMKGVFVDKFANNNLCGVLELPFKDNFDVEDYRLIADAIRASKTDIVWIGLGSGKQIKAAYALSKLLPEKVFVTVGAAFDFLSGNKKQAPVWMRDSGLEWLFRVVHEPRRLVGRYTRIMLFLISWIFKK